MSDVIDLDRNPVHLGLGATAIVQPTFTGDMAWYERYGAAHAADGNEGRLVTVHTFTEPWGVWEMHPQGSELVLCQSGEVTLLQEQGGEVVRTTLGPGQAVINEPGVWHTADASGEVTLLFITAGAGTQHRPR